MKMKITFEEIEGILVKHDFEGLIRMGAPPDEYHFESQLIYRSLKGTKRQQSSHYVQELIEYVFWKRFGHDHKWKLSQYSEMVEHKSKLIALEICESINARDPRK